MSEAVVKRRKVTIKQLLEKKRQKEIIRAIGVYDAPMAKIADRVGFDMLINGNGGPMSILGHAHPMGVLYEEQLALTKAVSRSTQYGFIVSHLPWMTYHTSKAQAIESGGRMMAEGGADAVKVEGNEYTAEYVAEMVRAGIPVVGHIGMQASRKIEQSGYGKKGRTAEEARDIVRSARAFSEAGVCAFIIEQVPNELTKYLAETLPQPVIGVVAGRDGDGIYEISGDLVGYTSFKAPSHKRVFANVGPIIEDAMRQFSDEVAAGNYPPKDHDLLMDPTEHKKFLDMVS
jgi:3-methyl-2-oxobutanoate hydroxymethyltransferase